MLYKTEWDDQFAPIKQWYNPTKGSPDFLVIWPGRAKLPGPVTKFKIAAKECKLVGSINYKNRYTENGKYGYREYIAVGLKKL